MGKRSRDKGATFERLICRLYRERFGWSETACYRSAPLQAANARTAGDITTPMPIWHELSHGARADGEAKLAQAQAAAPAAMVAVAVTRRDRGPILVTLRLGTIVHLSGGIPMICGGTPVTLTWDRWLDMVDAWWTGERGEIAA